jgi:hypothetical protein
MRPFHRIQKFVQGFFEASDLDNLGFKLDIRPHTHDCSPQSSRPARSYSDIYPISDDDGDDWEDDDETTINDSYGSEFRRLASDVGKTVLQVSSSVHSSGAPARMLQRNIYSFCAHDYFRQHSSTLNQHSPSRSWIISALMLLNAELQQ